MLGSEIIKKFELYTDDTTELAEQEELDLANKVLRKVYDIMPWEFLRKNATGVITAAGIPCPADFLHLMPNYSDDLTSSLPDTAVVYVSGQPFKVIPMASRFGANIANNTCWYNPSTRYIEFKQSMAGASYNYDYKFLPDDISLTTEPIIPTSHYLVVYGMLIDDSIILKMDKAKANLSENSAFYADNLTDLKSYNSKLFFV